VSAAVVQTLLLVLATAALAYILRRRLELLRKAAVEPRSGDWGQRLHRLLVIGFGQVRQPRYLVAGVVHIVLFAGFMVLSVRSLSLIAEPYFPRAMFLGQFYGSLKDWAGLLVLLGCAVATWRRVVVKPTRYHDRFSSKSHTGEALLILGLISLLMIADAVLDGAHLNAGQYFLPTEETQSFFWSYPLASVAGMLVPDDFATGLKVVRAAFWIHNTTLLVFLCLLPLGKHFHVMTALPNVFLSNFKPNGKIKPPSYAEDDFDALESVGVSKLEDFTWKQILDTYSCVDCGRCSDHCPAYATGTPLSPRMLSIKTRDSAYEHYPIFGAVTPVEKRPAFVGETITAEELWACTTCGACEEACPVTIEYIDRVVDMRRFLVDDGNLPTSLQKPMAALEKRGNPYGKMARKRGDWVKEVGAAADSAAGADNDGDGVRVLPKGEECQDLFFTDSCAAFDPRVQQTAIAFGNIAAQAGLDIGTLGKDEVDSGHEARRFGEEGLYLTLRDQNMEAFEQRDFQRLVTTDPHALNALRNDYELEQPVVHHSQVLAELLQQGKLPLQALPDNRRYTFHDPCYLGRHNGEYANPRTVLEAIPGIQTVEMERSRNRSFCCGGGSLNLFQETECDRRMGEMRLDMVAEADAEVVVTACPFCLINLEDAVKTTGREGAIEVIDLAELVQRSIAGAALNTKTQTPSELQD
jgi:Fe-S oxidoreductase